MSASDNPPPPADGATRHTLVPESELRIEVPVGASIAVSLRSGSAELFGAELPPERPLRLSGAKVAIFTWHGCVLDVHDEDKVDIIYVSEETESNVAYVNTHAQLEAMRDEATSSSSPPTTATPGNPPGDAPAEGGGGPRVLIAGPADCGKSSLARVLTAYAVKLGRSPLLVDLDASHNMLSVPGTLAAVPASSDGACADGYAASAVMTASGRGAMMPLVLWHGSPDLASHPDLYKAQVRKLGDLTRARLAGDAEAGASGVIVNASGWIEDAGYEYLLHAIESFRINVVLVLGHDRLYSMLGTHFKREAQKELEGASEAQSKRTSPKLIKLPRSGGVVSRDAAFRRASRSQCIRQYFYGAAVAPAKSPSDGGAAGTASSAGKFSPCLLEVSFSDVLLHRISNVSLSASLLPISAKQSTDPIQSTDVPASEITPKFQHAVWAVCHPSAAQKYEQSGSARDLYLAGVAGFVVVEKVDVDKALLSLLSPCAGSLPSKHLLVGDIFWME
ncbi:hypothetical protein ACHAWF_007446 [Thalassiosira exigua]